MGPRTPESNDIIFSHAQLLESRMPASQYLKARIQIHAPCNSACVPFWCVCTVYFSGQPPQVLHKLLLLSFLKCFTSLILWHWEHFSHFWQGVQCMVAGSWFSFKLDNGTMYLCSHKAQVLCAQGGRQSVRCARRCPSFSAVFIAQSQHISLRESQCCGVQGIKMIHIRQISWLCNLCPRPFRVFSWGWNGGIIAVKDMKYYMVWAGRHRDFTHLVSLPVQKGPYSSLGLCILRS